MVRPLDGETIQDYPDRPNLIIKVLKSERERKNIGWERCDMRRTRPIVAGIENGGRQPWIKEGSREIPSATDSKKMGILILQLQETKLFQQAKISRKQMISRNGCSLLTSWFEFGETCTGLLTYKTVIK